MFRGFVASFVGLDYGRMFLFGRVSAELGLGASAPTMGRGAREGNVEVREEASRREGGLHDQFEREGEGAMQDRPQFARSARASS